MSLWGELTERHKFYVAIATLFGVAVGALAGLLIAIALGIIFASFGGGVLLMRREEWNSDRAYAVWMSIGVGALVVGLACFFGAFVFLLLHQQGSI